MDHVSSLQLGCEHFLISSLLFSLQVPAEERIHGRWPKLYAAMEKTLRALGLKPKRFQTISFQALAVDRRAAAAWLLREGHQEQEQA